MRGKLALCILDDNDKIISKKEINTEYDEVLDSSFKGISGNLYSEMLSMFLREVMDSIDRQMIQDLIKEQV
jgi:hypothetical protein